MDEAALFGYLDGKLEHGSIGQCYNNVDTVPGDKNLRAWKCFAKAYNQNSETIEK